MDRFRTVGEPPVEELLAVLDAMPTNIAIGQAVRGPGGHIEDFELVFVNDHTQDGAGRRAAVLVGGRVCELYPGWRDSGLFDLFVTVVETGQPFSDKAFHYRDVLDGDAIEGYWSLQVQKFRDGYLAVSYDAADEVRAAAEAEADAQVRAAVQVLQEVALPLHLPTVPGLDVDAIYQPAQRTIPIGGDWYDSFRRPDGKVALVVGDVAGQGQRAAIVMVRISNLVHYLGLGDTAPAALLAAISEIVVDTWSGFATCCVVLVDPETGDYEWASAGHPPPILLTSSGPTVLPWLTNSPPLGVTASSAVTTHVGRLDPGDVLVLFTDGLVERAGSDLVDDIWRLARTMQELRTAPVADLLAEALATADGAADDMCVLAARRTGATTRRE